MPAEGAGRLVAIARRSRRREPMVECETVGITLEGGVEGDHKGAKRPDRAVTILAREDWLGALAELDEAGPLPWTIRRANLLVEGVRLPRAVGGLLRIGEVEFEVTAPTLPCRRMDEARPGLLRALAREGRGGICCRVRRPGTLVVGDVVEVLHAPAERRRVLPG
jgi:MOSC domain-containing protein YiiM